MQDNQGVRVNIKKLAYAGALVAIGILLPQAFHIFGANAGMLFLPIQIPVLIAGAILGGIYGGTIGVIVPMLSFLMTGMPPAPKVWFMVVELGIYGLAMGVLVKKCNIYITLLISMVLGRVAYAIALGTGVVLLGMQAPFMNQAAFLTGIVQGVPGIVIQLVLIPILYKRLKDGGFLFEDQIRRSKKDIEGTKR